MWGIAKGEEPKMRRRAGTGVKSLLSLKTDGMGLQAAGSPGGPCLRWCHDQGGRLEKDPDKGTLIAGR
jgi:hypothetical protein